MASAPPSHIARGRLLALACLLASAPPGAQVQDRPTPQKFREFYSAQDAARIPAAIRTRLADPQTLAQAGRVRWRLQPDAIIRDTAPVARLDAQSGLPIGQLRVIEIASDEAVWAGGNDGLVRYDGAATHAWDRWQYFGGRRYLPSDLVVSLAAGEGGSMWVRTDAGVSHIFFKPLTLAQKAAAFDARVTVRHTRHGLVADSELKAPGDLATSHQYPNDNDGLWTAIYAAAQVFRYAVTKDEAALHAARAYLNAMLRLEAITGRSGFPARSFRHKSEPRHADGEWHFTGGPPAQKLRRSPAEAQSAEAGEWEWKGDTSSDELVGHFFAYALAYDLLPDAALKSRLRGAVARIADHLIEHKYYLTDIDGEPTRWGRYTLEYFNTPGNLTEMALNSAEILSHLKVAVHVTGDAKYEREYRTLIEKHGYARNVATYLKYREEINYSDEELAMLTYYPLIRYEKDPALLAQYRAGMAEWWQNIQREDNPLWIYIMAASDPSVRPSLKAAARTLARIPMDQVKWSVRNSHRHDVPFDPALDRHQRKQTTRLLPPDERRVMKWNANPFQLDDEGGGRGEDDGAFFLLPYWMGRYHGYLR